MIIPNIYQKLFLCLISFLVAANAASANDRLRWKFSGGYFERMDSGRWIVMQKGKKAELESGFVYSDPLFNPPQLTSDNLTFYPSNITVVSLNPFFLNSPLGPLSNIREGITTQPVLPLLQGKSYYGIKGVIKRWL